MTINRNDKVRWKMMRNDDLIKEARAHWRHLQHGHAASVEEIVEKIAENPAIKGADGNHNYQLLDDSGPAVTKDVFDKAVKGAFLRQACYLTSLIWASKSDNIKEQSERCERVVMALKHLGLDTSGITIRIEDGDDIKRIGEKTAEFAGQALAVIQKTGIRWDFLQLRDEKFHNEMNSELERLGYNIPRTALGTLTTSSEPPEPYYMKEVKRIVLEASDPVEYQLGLQGALEAAAFQAVKERAEFRPTVTLEDLKKRFGNQNPRTDGFQGNTAEPMLLKEKLQRMQGNTGQQANNSAKGNFGKPKPRSF